MDNERVAPRKCIFPNQHLAIQFQRNHPSRRLWAYQYKLCGSRKFFVFEPDEFWFWYKSFSDKHCHEVIQEGIPCRLFFDLEYDKRFNPRIKEDEMLQEFITLVNERVAAEFGLNVSSKSWLLLDSSTDARFSVHAVVHFPNNLLFDSCQRINTFIEILKDYMIGRDIGMVDSEKGMTTVCDKLVYSKNRQFRMFLSTKLASQEAFTVRKGCIFYDRLPDDEIVFQDSLVVPVNYRECPILPKIML